MAEILLIISLGFLFLRNVHYHENIIIRNRATKKLINSVELDIETTQKLIKKNEL